MTVFYLALTLILTISPRISFWNPSETINFQVWRDFALNASELRVGWTRCYQLGVVEGDLSPEYDCSIDNPYTTHRESWLSLQGFYRGDRHFEFAWHLPPGYYEGFAEIRDLDGKVQVRQVLMFEVLESGR